VSGEGKWIIPLSIFFAAPRNRAGQDRQAASHKFLVQERLVRPAKVQEHHIVKEGCSLAF